MVDQILQMNLINGGTYDLVIIGLGLCELVVEGNI